MVTGLGVCAPNGVGVPNFQKAIEEGKSGIRFFSELKKLNFSCQIGGMPLIPESKKLDYFTPLQLRNFNSSGILYGVFAGMEAWHDAGLEINEENCDFDSGTIFGVGSLGVDKYRESIYQVDAGHTRRLGSTSVQQTMSSGISAYLGGMLGLGNLVTTNSSACSTGTEAILLAYERIKSGKAKRMLAGSTSDGGPYVWSGFDALRILPSEYNENPMHASRPMDKDAKGFVPGGSMTAPNPVSVKRCIKDALEDAGVQSHEIDAINGHLTATAKDALEIHNWTEALGRDGKDFPFINSLKGMTGHCLAAAGSIECVASVLQLKYNFLFPNINIDNIHSEISSLIHPSCIPQKKLNKKLKILAKASFGFGDVNCCLIFSQK